MQKKQQKNNYASKQNTFSYGYSNDLKDSVCYNVKANSKVVFNGIGRTTVFIRTFQ